MTVGGEREEGGRIIFRFLLRVFRCVVVLVIELGNLEEERFGWGGRRMTMVVLDMLNFKVFVDYLGKIFRGIVGFNVDFRFY